MNVKLVSNQRLSGLILVGLLGLLLGFSQAQSLPSELAYDDPQPPFYTPTIPVDHHWELSPNQPNEPEQAPEPPQVIDQTRAALQEILTVTNQYRSRNGLSPLQLDSRLEQVATGHSAEMLDLNYFSHTSPVSSHSTVMKRVRVVGHRPNYVAENIFESFGQDIRSAARLAIDGWIDSPGHRRNILSSRATHVGIGLVERNGTVSVTQVFAAGI